MSPSRHALPLAQPMVLFRTVLLACLAGLVLGACEASFNPILESDRNFTLWGTLDMNQSVQYVRVVPIRPTLDPGVAAPLNVTFTSTDLVTGERLAWRDSVVTFANGSYGHVFYTPLRPRPGHTYRLEVQPQDGTAVTSAVTSVPAAPQPFVMPEEISGVVGTGIAQGSQLVRWQGLTEDPFLLETWYRFLISEGAAFQDVRLPYETPNVLGSDALEATLDLRRDRITLDTLVNMEEAALAGLGMQVTLLDTAFVPPGGVFDPEALVQPGTFSNVQNGFGFVGSVAHFSVEWLLRDDAARQLAYLTLEDAFGKRAPDVLAQAKQAAATAHAPPGDHSGFQ